MHQPQPIKCLHTQEYFYIFLCCKTLFFIQLVSGIICNFSYTVFTNLYVVRLQET